MSFQEHHFRNLARSRDALTETILSLRSASDRMVGDDWIDARGLLDEMTEDIGPRLARLRDAASERFDDHTRLPDFDAMRTGKLPFPDERLALVTDPPPLTAEHADIPRLVCPNAKVGAELVAQHGGVDAALMAYEPDSPEYDHVQAYRYVTTRVRPQGWVPPIA